MKDKNSNVTKKDASLNANEDKNLQNNNNSKPYKLSNNTFYLFILIIILFVITLIFWLKLPNLRSYFGISEQVKLDKKEFQIELYDYINNKINGIENNLASMQNNMENIVKKELQQKIENINKSYINTLTKINLSSAINLLQNAILNLNYSNNTEKLIKDLENTQLLIERSEIKNQDFLNRNLREIIYMLQQEKSVSKQSKIKIINSISDNLYKIDLIHISEKQKYSAQEQIKNIKNSNNSNSIAKTNDSKENKLTWKDKLYGSYQEIKDFITIKSKDDKEEILNKINILFIKERIFILLEQVKLAILSNNADAYHENLTLILTVLNNYNSNNEDIFAKITQDLKKLESMDFISLEKPISEVLRELNEIYLSI